MDQRRLLELALETLKAQKERIELEIRALSKGVRTAAATLVSASPATATPKRKPRTAAQRKAQAKKMRAYWAKRKAQAAKQSKPRKPGRTARRRAAKPAEPAS